MIRAFVLLLLMQLCGDLLGAALRLPLPGTLIGMVLLLAFMSLKPQAGQWLEDTAQPLLRNLMLLLIPYIAGIVTQMDSMAGQWLPFFLACVLGAVLSLAATAWTLRWMLARQARAEAGHAR